MSGRRSLTEIAQEAWSRYLRPGSWALDATAGNGLDTECLARLVGKEGRVFAVDIQEIALEITRQRLLKAGLADRVSLVRGDHGRLRELLACGTRGRIGLACFNLGYLPNGDHAIRTRPSGTIPALMEALLQLAPDGALSVVTYRGHDGAMEEAAAVERFFNTLPRPWTCVEQLATGSAEKPGPVWWLAATEGD